LSCGPLIREIAGYHLRFTPRIPLGNSRTFIRSREVLAIELKTDAGHSGWGEVFASPWAAAALIKTKFGPMLLGKPAGAFGRHYAGMLDQVGYDRRGPAMMAISALDMALHDAAARIRGQSVADMLGGPIRRSIPAYASGPFIREGARPYEGFEEEAERCVKRGFRYIKPRAGVDPRADGRMVLSLRNTLGADVGLMVDINQGYTARAAVMAAVEMQGAGLLWIEEPVMPEDLEGYRAIANATSIPIAGGEALASLAAYREFVHTGVGVLQPDMTVCGGFTGFRAIASIGAACDLPVMPHVFSSVINLYASLQMAALLPPRKAGAADPYPLIEYDATENPLLELRGCPIARDGTITLPDGPGIGVDIQPSMFERWTVDRWSVTP
jgi:D-galactarolactone cycloisomerase